MDAENHVTDFLPAFALGCLGEAETRQVSEHLAGCETCRLELQAYQRAADALPLALSETTPPPALKAKIMQAIAPPVVATPPLSANLYQRLNDFLRRAAPGWAFAGLAVIFLLAFSNLLLWQRLGTLEAQRSAFSMVRLEATDAAPQANGVVILSADGRTAALIVNGLPQLDAGQQYQLWLIEGEQRASGAVFSVSDAGGASLPVQALNKTQSLTGFGITIEPFGGSPGPTGKKVLGGEL